MEQVTVLFTTADIHGHVYEVPEKSEIGYALLKAYIDSTKADQKILIDTGDNFAEMIASTFKRHGKDFFTNAAIIFTITKQ